MQTSWQCTSPRASRWAGQEQGLLCNSRTPADDSPPDPMHPLCPGKRRSACTPPRPHRCSLPGRSTAAAPSRCSGNSTSSMPMSWQVGRLHSAWLAGCKAGAAASTASQRCPHPQPLARHACPGAPPGARHQRGSHLCLLRCRTLGAQPRICGARRRQQRQPAQGVSRSSAGGGAAGRGEGRRLLPICGAVRWHCRLPASALATCPP